MLLQIKDRGNIFENSTPARVTKYNQIPMSLDCSVRYINSIITDSNKYLFHNLQIFHTIFAVK